MNIHDYRTVTIRSLSYGNRKVILHIEKQRYVCPYAVKERLPQ
ncbi:transposase family protein [Leptotrichia sp. oral taxon 221]|nr:transposase family protein [Leptotrichia sp. oral taxon 221]